MPRRKKSRRRIARPQLGTMPNLALNSGYQNRKLRAAKWGSEMGFDGLFAAQRFKGAHVADGSKPEKLNESKCFPLFTQQRTLPRYFGMSVSCHHRTHVRNALRTENKQLLCRGGVPSDSFRITPAIAP